ncbi:MAG: hypothetical protein LUQ14_02580 [Methanomassiliicoccales archaeon]|nr:hypothetical protein [Methanomassiliicoccales archaeon]
MEVDHRIANATSGASLAPATETRQIGSAGSIAVPGFDMAKPSFIYQLPASSNCFSARGEMMLGLYPKSKALCSCGEIAEMDSSVVRLKRRLGKDIECRTCRNQRIAKELEALEMHFSGQGEGLDS